MKRILLFCGILLPAIVFACLNEDHVTKTGKHTGDYFTLGELAFFKTQDTVSLKKELQKLLEEKPVKEEDIVSVQNDIAVKLIKLGRLQEAEKILTALYKKNPNKYSVTINLGTLYELQGKNAAALDLIKKAIAIDPESHNGSEWFHVKILEYKLKNIPDSKIADQLILNLSSVRKRAGDVAGNVTYQLQERIPFTPAPNLLMAKILQEFGDYLADSLSISGAYVMYDMGMDYDRTGVLNLQAKRDELKPYFNRYKLEIPRTGVYYLDRVITEIDNNKTAIVTSLLDKGLNYYKELEEKERRREQQRRLFIYGGIGTAALLVLLLFFILRRKKQNA